MIYSGSDHSVMRYPGSDLATYPDITKTKARLFWDQDHLHEEQKSPKLCFFLGRVGSGSRLGKIIPDPISQKKIRIRPGPDSDTQHWNDLLFGFFKEWKHFPLLEFVRVEFYLFIFKFCLWFQNCWRLSRSAGIFVDTQRQGESKLNITFTAN